MVLRYSNRDRSLETRAAHSNSARDEDGLLRETWETRYSRPSVRTAAAIPAREFSVREIMENLSCPRSTTNWNWLAHLGLRPFASVKSGYNYAHAKIPDRNFAIALRGTRNWWKWTLVRAVVTILIHTVRVNVCVNAIEFFYRLCKLRDRHNCKNAMTWRLK